MPKQPAPGSHPCYIPACRCLHVSKQYLMCRYHWNRVPRHIQKLIWETCGGVQPEIYWRAVRDACLLVAKKEGTGEEIVDKHLRAMQTPQPRQGGLEL